MIGVIPNPKKSLQIEKPISDVKAAIVYLYLYTTKYKMYYQSRTSVPQGGFGAENAELRCGSNKYSIPVHRLLSAAENPEKLSLAPQHLT